MRKVKFLLLAALTAMFVGCQSDEVLEQDSGSDRPTPIGDTRITIEGEGMKDVTTRSSDGRVDFTGGYATGAGLYNGTAKPTVAAYPNPGYEVNYFYGGPTNEPQKYAQSSASSFEVSLGGQDHTFHCGFKEKKRDLTVNAGPGGSVSPSGTNSYQVENAINITATPNTGYKFSGWTVTEGDVTIANTGSSSTTATLHNSNSTITANFQQDMVEFEYNLYYNENEYYYSISKPVPFDIVISEHIRSDEGHGADARSIIIAGTTKSDINYCEPNFPGNIIQHYKVIEIENQTFYSEYACIEYLGNRYKIYVKFDMLPSIYMD